MSKDQTVKERPILFKGPMVRAILEGRKTQTRRVVKPQPFLLPASGDSHFLVDKKGRWACDVPSDRAKYHCPYGIPGDRLWVRETWQIYSPDELIGDEPNGEWWGNPSLRVVWKATSPVTIHPLHPEWGERRWMPSIHMHRSSSRLTLEVTAVRVERVQDISDADALAEGIMPFADGFAYDNEGRGFHCTKPTVSYAYLWDSINGNWEQNPWVWVVEFKRVEVKL